MDANKNKIIKNRVKRALKALEANNISAAYTESKEDALKLVKQLVPKGSFTSSGGSVTLRECGIEAYLREETDYLDFFSPSLTREERAKLYLTDCFLLSANAITEHGEIYQVDGRSNRVSALLHGPERVIIIAGVNKLVRTLRDAVERVKYTAAPMNATRLCKDTVCAKTGLCVSPALDSDNLMCGAKCGEECICSNTVIMARQKEKGRITVILVGEDLGY
jgi:Uncharacterised ACR, YkgG family COG1556.